MDVLARDGELSVRPMRDDPADYAVMAKWLADPRVLEFWDGRDRPSTLEQVRQKYSERIANPDKTVPSLIVLDERPIGYFQFYPLDTSPEWRDRIGFSKGDGSYGIDLFIGAPELWGQGLGTRVLRAMLDTLFGRGATRIVLSAFTSNHRAIRAYEKAGFRKERLLPRFEMHEGELRDEWLMVAEPSG